MTTSGFPSKIYQTAIGKGDPIIFPAICSLELPASLRKISATAIEIQKVTWSLG